MSSSPWTVKRFAFVGNNCFVQAPLWQPMCVRHHARDPMQNSFPSSAGHFKKLTKLNYGSSFYLKNAASNHHSQIPCNKKPTN